MSNLSDNERELSFPPPPPLEWQFSVTQELEDDRLLDLDVDLDLDWDQFTQHENHMHQSSEIDMDIVNFNLFTLSEISSVSTKQPAKTAPFDGQTEEIHVLTIEQFSTHRYTRHNIGELVAGFMALQSSTHCMYIPNDIHSIVFQFYYEEENEVLHFSEKVFRTLEASQTSSSCPSSSSEFTGNQLMNAVEHCVRHEPAVANLETHSMSHKLLQFKYIELVAYVSTFSSLFSATLPMNDDFDEKHRYKFAANRVDQYLSAAKIYM
mmetsp:Transcript_65813/g.104829  ORF Transcript_65813/g.104829 Transcript_65813/m.104829 type:complete len:265 (-) Transcript_65813:26-820(-)